MTHPRISSVYSRAHGPAPTGSEAADRNHAARVEAWQRHGLVVLHPDEIAGEWFRAALIAEADLRFGKRGGI